MADEEKDQKQGEQGTQAAPVAAKAPAPPTAETALEPATANPLEQTVLDEAQVRAILSLPQIQQHIAAAQKPIQSARDKERQRANTAEQVASLTEEERQTLFDRQQFLGEAVSFYAEVKGVPKEDLEDVRDFKELLGRVKMAKGATPTPGDPSNVDPAVLRSALEQLKPGTAGTPLAPANGQGVQRGAYSDREITQLLGDGQGGPEEVKRGREILEKMGVRLT